ncbi:YjcQ family protein [Bacillus dakarensis]|uniref:YjcQ family protein n=1 Tax=Robertmurraya dakarensis TaxID=1926278 RepID=UPI000981AC2D|nr:YjcQ family protein [Bacillus dakarensis]
MDKLDIKQRVLVTFYIEYQKDLPEMEKVNATDLGISHDIFKMALLKLINEGLITGVEFTRGGQGNKILGAFTTNILMTSKGIDYVEQKLGITPTLTAGEKVREVSKKVAEWGYNEIKDFTVKVAAEIAKSAMGLNGK